MYKGVSRLADILQITVVIRRVVFLLFLLFYLGRGSAISSSQNVLSFPPFSQALPKPTEIKRNLVLRASRLRYSFFLAIDCTIDVILSDIAKFGQRYRVMKI